MTRQSEPPGQQSCTHARRSSPGPGTQPPHQETKPVACRSRDSLCFTWQSEAGQQGASGERLRGGWAGRAVQGQGTVRVSQEEAKGSTVPTLGTT